MKKEMKKEMKVQVLQIKIIESIHAVEFEREVNEALAEGWSIHTPFNVSVGRAAFWCCLCRYETIEREDEKK